ncbi:MAG: alpha-L-fucosidase [Kiritimatiellia bacterium]
MPPRFTRFISLVCLLLLMHGASSRAESAEELVYPYANESVAERDARMKWWRQAKFGMFIHWGVYAVPAGRYQDREIKGYGEWIMEKARIPVATYKEYAHAFNPVNYDPVSWAKLARKTGMKYVVITAKHHDGFSLYDSAVTDWDMEQSPYPDKDLLGPLVKAVKDEGLKMGFYYSQDQDWTHPGGAKWRGREHQAHEVSWDKAQDGDFDTYLDTIAVPQVRELLTGYDIDVLWWDTPKYMTPERALKLASLLSLRPGIIHNDRLGGGIKGDTVTPEQSIPPTGYEDGRDWETCMTLNETWGYKVDDHDWKSVTTLVRNLVDVVSKGGNYLLNIGPKADGTIPPESVELLDGMGAWMDVHGESIYDTQASPVMRPFWGRITRKDREGGATLYLHVFDWPVEEGAATAELRLHLDNEPLTCVRLDTGEAVKVTRGPDGIRVVCEGQAPNPHVTVLRMEIEVEPRELDTWVEADDQGRFDLPIDMLSVDPANLRHQIRQEVVYNGPHYVREWGNTNIALTWHVRAPEAGTYRLAYSYAGKAGRMALQVLDEAGGEVFSGEKDTPSTRNPRDVESTQDGPGPVNFPGAGVYEVRLYPTAQAHVPRLFGLALEPVE